MSSKISTYTKLIQSLHKKGNSKNDNATVKKFRATKIDTKYKPTPAHSIPSTACLLKRTTTIIRGISTGKLKMLIKAKLPLAFEAIALISVNTAAKPVEANNNTTKNKLKFST